MNRALVGDVDGDHRARLLEGSYQLDIVARLPWLANARGSLGQLLPILAAKLQRGSVRISAAISWPRVTTARAIAATIGS